MAEVRESWLLRIGTPDPARIWGGVGNLVIPADIVEASDATYLGAGELLSVPDFQQLINGVAERVEFIVSGVSDETVRLALEEAPDVRNAQIHAGRVDFGEDWQIVGVEWEAVWRADFLVVDSESAGGIRQRTIKLSAGTDDTGRSYAPASYFTDSDQRLRSETDAFCDHVAGITQGTARVFGPRYKEKSGGFF